VIKNVRQLVVYYCHRSYRQLVSVVVSGAGDVVRGGGTHDSGKSRLDSVIALGVGGVAGRRVGRRGTLQAR
jgi:predicted phosphodiesterase